MALIFDGIECPLCGEVIDLNSQFVATTHFIGDRNDQLHRYSDAAMHYTCFQNWDHREEFIDRYNNTIGRTVWGNGTRHHMRPDGTIESVPA